MDGRGMTQSEPAVASTLEFVPVQPLGSPQVEALVPQRTTDTRKIISRSSVLSATER
jgi:hypothetical protein